MRRSIKKRIKSDTSSENIENSSNNFSRKHRQRMENSLGELTKNVIKYIKKSGENDIQINNLVEDLNVKKRRIYDITNVLEGIGCIEKIEKNKLRWIDKTLYNYSEFSVNQEIGKFESEINSLQSEMLLLENWITEIKENHEQLNNDKKFKDFCFLTFDDIKSLTKEEETNLIAIRAPPGTTLEIPDPESVEKVFQQTEQNMIKGIDKYDRALLDSLQKNYQLFLESPNGEINLFLVLSDTKNSQREKFFSFSGDDKNLVDCKENRIKIIDENKEIGV